MASRSGREAGSTVTVKPCAADARTSEFSCRLCANAQLFAVSSSASSGMTNPIDIVRPLRSAAACLLGE